MRALACRFRSGLNRSPMHPANETPSESPFWIHPAPCACTAPCLAPIVLTFRAAHPAIAMLLGLQSSVRPLARAPARAQAQRSSRRVVRVCVAQQQETGTVHAGRGGAHASAPLLLHPIGCLHSGLRPTARANAPRCCCRRGGREHRRLLQPGQGGQAAEQGADAAGEGGALHFRHDGAPAVSLPLSLVST